MKKLLKVLLVLVILVLVGVAVAWLSLDVLVKTGVEKGGTYALKVPTSLNLASVHVFGGEIVLNGLNIANPKDFTTPHLMKSGKIDVTVDIGSLTGSTVRVSKFVIEGLDVFIEQKGLGTSNVSVMMDNISPPAGGGTEAQKKDAAKESSGRKIAVNQILVKNVTAHVQLLPLGEREVLAPPEFLEPLGPAEIDRLPLLNGKRAGPELAELALDLALQGPHRGHDNNDREYPHQHPQQRECRPQLVRGQRAHGHEKAFPGFGEQER